MSTTDAAHEFWTVGDSDRQKLAKEYERNIEMYHPDTVSSKGMCVCLDYCHWCGWAGTSVKYMRYNGPDVKNI